jgi:hypothetical protein
LLPLGTPINICGFPGTDILRYAGNIQTYGAVQFSLKIIRSKY